VFSEAELATIDHVLDDLAGLTATQVTLRRRLTSPTPYPVHVALGTDMRTERDMDEAGG
jgi:hypothetical protein